MAKKILLWWFLLWGALSAAEPSRPVYVIPVRDDIEQSIVFLVRRGVKEAMEHHASALILDMDTNGGRGDSMEEIMNILSRFEPHDQTYTLVNNKAFSAGAFIASATRHIYMTPDAVIGAATPVMIGSGGGVENLPPSYEAKITSAFLAVIRSSAERNGHNPEVFAAMVDRDHGLSVDGKEIVPKGKILTLTSSQATAHYGNPSKPLLADGTANDLDKLIHQLADGAQVVRVEPTGFEQIARWITIISPVLLSIGMLLIYLEFKAPSLVLGSLAALCFLIFFFGHYIAGLSGYEYVILFFIGLVLVLAEIWLLPGSVILGLSGAALLIGAILFAMIDQYPTDPWLPSPAQFEFPVVKLALAITAALVAAMGLAAYLPKRQLFGQLARATISGPSLPKTFAHGVQVGDQGMTTSPLRPSGKARFGEETLDVVTEGSHVARDARVRVIRVEGVRIVVEES